SSGAPLNFMGRARAGFGRACAHETALRRRQTGGATNGPKLGVGPAHHRKSPDPVLQRSKLERAFAHIIGETEADPLPGPAQEPCTLIGFFWGGKSARRRVPPGVCRRLAPPTVAPIIAGFFFGRFEGSRGGKPVAIIRGSQSDWPTMKHTADTLDALGIGYVAKIISAHRTPERHLAFTKAGKGQGLRIIIAG